MKQPNLPHLLHYLILVVLMFVGIGAIVIFGGHPSLRVFIILGLSGGYLVWGVAHHYLERTLNWEIFIEYLLYSLLGSALVFSVLRFLS